MKIQPFKSSTDIWGKEVTFTNISKYLYTEQFIKINLHILNFLLFESIYPSHNL